jgi:hypothetical protein
MPRPQADETARAAEDSRRSDDRRCVAARLCGCRTVALRPPLPHVRAHLPRSWVRMGACGNACPCACLRCSLSFFAGHGSDHARYPPTRFHCDYSHPSRSLSSRREILRNEKQTAGLRSSSPDVSMTRPGARRGTTGRSPRRGLGRWARTRTCQRADGSWVGTQAGMACALRRRRGHRRSNGSAEPNGPASTPTPGLGVLSVLSL